MIKNSNIRIKKLLSVCLTFLLVTSFPSWGIEKEKDPPLLIKLSKPYNPNSLEQTFLAFGNNILYSPAYTYPPIPFLSREPHPFHISNLSSIEEAVSPSFSNTSYASSSMEVFPSQKPSALEMLATTSLQDASPSYTVHSLSPSLLSISSVPSVIEETLSPSSPLLTNQPRISLMPIEEEPSSQTPPSPASSRNSPSPIIEDSLTVSKKSKLKKKLFSSKKKKKKGHTFTRKRIKLTKEQIEECLHLTQVEAAEKLGVSLSTFKRRVYELLPETRWPYKLSQETRAKRGLQENPQLKGFFSWRIKDKP